MAFVFAENESLARRVPSELYAETRWYACYTRARHEKRVDRMLSDRGIDTYLPLVRRERRWKDRKKMVEFPLFPGYLFGRFSLDDLHRVLDVPGVSTVVRMNGLPVPIREEELASVRRFAAVVSERGEAPEPEPLVAEGQRVRVVAGPFKGVEAIVEEVRGRKRVLVGITAIRQGFEVDIPVKSLQAIQS